MQDNYSDQTSQFTSAQNEQKEDNVAGFKHEHAAGETAVSEIKFRGVMSQYEMEILTRLFPKCAQTLADVLRNRPRPLSREL